MTQLLSLLDGTSVTAPAVGAVWLMTWWRTAP